MGADHPTIRPSDHPILALSRPPAVGLPVGPGFAHAAGEVPLLKTLVRTIRAMQYSIRTEQAYVDWCRQFLAFRGDAPTARLGVEEGSTS